MMPRMLPRPARLPLKTRIRLRLQRRADKAAARLYWAGREEAARRIWRACGMMRR